MEKPNTQIKGSLPLRPHLFNFLSTKYHLDPGQPLPLPGRTVAGEFLASLLLDKNALYDDARQTYPDTYTAELSWVLSESRSERPAIFLSDSRIIKFNTFLHQLLHDDLFQLIQFNYRHGRMTEKEVIYKFIESHQLYDIEFDSLKKASYRHRRRHNLDIFCSGKRPTVSGNLNASKSRLSALRNCPTVSGYNVHIG